MVLRIGCGRCQVVLNYVLALICTSKVSWTGDLLWPVLEVGEVSVSHVNLFIEVKSFPLRKLEGFSIKILSKFLWSRV